MSLDNAFLVLGERESGTERLDQAVAAYRAALDPDQAFTWPNQASSRTATHHGHRSRSAARASAAASRRFRISFSAFRVSM